MKPISSIAIIGAGVMGRGIAEANLKNGIAVTLADSDAAACRSTVKTLVAVHGPSRTTGLRVATGDADFDCADLVIEAITEKLSAKQNVLSHAERHVRDSAILATNTSSIPISQIATALARPQQFCGLHFCHPVHRRPLVEIVRGAKTSDETIASAGAYVHSIGKSPIVVGDCPGFVVNRLLSPYLNESIELILDGAEPAMVEAAARAFGMPAGPLRQFDEYGLDVAVRSGALLRAAYPDRFVVSDLPVALFGLGRLGRKSGAGFFAYSKTLASNLDAPFTEPARAELDTTVTALIDERKRATRKLAPAEITMRLFLPMLLEATRILEERIASSAADIDEALCGGLGFQPLEGGLLRWADMVGPQRLIAALNTFAPLGKRYEATPVLCDLAATARSMYDTFPRSESISRAA